MRKDTDLRQVKATARALLMLELGETDFSPIIVENHVSVKCVSDHDQHLPFVDGRNRP